MALEMSHRLGWLSAAERDRGIRLLRRAGLPVVPPAEMTAEDFMEHMAVDKKVLDGRLRLVLLQGLGMPWSPAIFPVRSWTRPCAPTIGPWPTSLEMNEVP